MSVGSLLRRLCCHILNINWCEQAGGNKCFMSQLWWNFHAPSTVHQDICASKGQTAVARLIRQAEMEKCCIRKMPLRPIWGQAGGKADQIFHADVRWWEVLFHHATGSRNTPRAPLLHDADVPFIALLRCDQHPSGGSGDVLRRPCHEEVQAGRNGSS